MERIVIFGAGDIAEIAHFYFTNDTDHKVVAFSVDKEYLKATTFCGLPVIPFEEIATSHPPEDCAFFVALSYARMNQVRADKYEATKAKGYRLVSYISSRATHYGTPIGDNCFIFEDNTIQPFTRIGDNVTIWSGNHIGHHSTIGDHCFISSHVVISGGVVIEPYCFIGVNATLRDHITIAEKSLIGAGALILKNTEKASVHAPSATEARSITSDRLSKI